MANSSSYRSKSWPTLFVFYSCASRYFTLASYACIFSSYWLLYFLTLAESDCTSSSIWSLYVLLYSLIFRTYSLNLSFYWLIFINYDEYFTIYRSLPANYSRVSCRLACKDSIWVSSTFLFILPSSNYCDIWSQICCSESVCLLNFYIVSDSNVRSNEPANVCMKVVKSLMSAFIC